MPFRMLFDEKSERGRCLDELSHGQWLSFVFDHPTPRSKSTERWYNQPESQDYYFKDSLRLLEHLEVLFKRSTVLAYRYRPDQIRQGFWCLISAFELPDVLEDAGLPLPPRRGLLSGLEGVYQDLFAHPVYAKLAFLYWDPLTYYLHGCRHNPESGDHRALRVAAIQALARILEHEAPHSRLGALHGLGHLGGPDSLALIKDYLGESGPAAPDAEYAMACLNGSMDAIQPPLESPVKKVGALGLG